MTHADQLNIYRAQTRNVKDLAIARKQVTRSINHALRANDPMSAQVHTKLLVLIFCAWAEASFSKLIHTPHGFPLIYIAQIKEVHRVNGIHEAWKKVLDLGISRSSTHQKTNFLPNARKKLLTVINDFIASPALIRNKIAHGQWSIALNRGNTACNPDLTNQVSDIDIILLEKWFGAYQHLGAVIEALIESPGKSIHKDYWLQITMLDEFLTKTSHWSLAAKIELLKRKPLQRGRPRLASNELPSEAASVDEVSPHDRGTGLS